MLSHVGLITSVERDQIVAALNEIENGFIHCRHGSTHLELIFIKITPQLKAFVKVFIAIAVYILLG